MPLVLEPKALARAALEELVKEMVEGLEELRPMATSPKARVIDPTSLLTARELLDAALATIRRPGERTDDELAADANLGYATQLAVLDLVKSHTDVPRVPRPRPKSPP